LTRTDPAPRDAQENPDQDASSKKFSAGRARGRLKAFGEILAGGDLSPDLIKGR
jgi:hypothetical protein